MASRQELYHNYLNELKMFNPNLILLKAEDIFKNYKEVSQFRDLEWIDIYHGVEIVGFILLTNGPHCPVAYDWFVMECYVDPKYRRKHLMKNAMQKVIQSHPGTFGMFILSKNKVAADFWNNFIQRKEPKSVDSYCYAQSLEVARNSVPSGIDCFERAFQVNACNS